MKTTGFFTAIAVAAIAFSAICFNSCKSASGSALTTDSIVKSYNSDTLAIANLKIDYPKDGGSEILDSARAYICNELGKHFIDVDENGKPRKTNATFSGDIKDGNAVAEFYGNAFKKEISDMRKADTMLPSTIGYVHDVSIKKLCDSETFVTFLTTDYCFLGGAHGNETVIGATLSKDRGHLISQPVDTNKVKELQPLLRKGLVKYFSNQDSNINENNLTDFLFIDGNLIPMPATSPYFTADGIVFTYQQYEIAPYAAGQPSFTLSYKDVASYLTKEAFEVAEPFLKK